MMDEVVTKATRGGWKCRVFEMTWQAGGLVKRSHTQGGWLPCVGR
jgi:hypothetical protein